MKALPTVTVRHLFTMMFQDFGSSPKADVTYIAACIEKGH